MKLQFSVNQLLMSLCQLWCLVLLHGTLALMQDMCKFEDNYWSVCDITAAEAGIERNTSEYWCLHQVWCNSTPPDSVYLLTVHQPSLLITQMTDWHCIFAFLKRSVWRVIWCRVDMTSALKSVWTAIYILTGLQFLLYFCCETRSQLIYEYIWWAIFSWLLLP